MLVRALDWGPERVADEVERTLLARRGMWTAGVYGAIAEFGVLPDDDVEVERDGPVVTARSDGGGLRFDLTGSAAFTVALRSRPDALRSIIVAVPGPDQGVGPDPGAGLPGLPGPAAAVVTTLGPDHGALRPDDAGTPRWDLGLGFDTMRFCVRTRDPGVAAALERTEGACWHDLVHRAGRLLVDRSPDRIVETPLGRVEITTPIPPPDGVSPEGPHTHLLGRELAKRWVLPRNTALPPGWVHGATYYP